MTNAFVGSVRIGALAGALLGAMALSTAAQADGDAEAGAKVFRKCQVCHSTDAGKNLAGPSLSSILGRHAGEVDGFKYSTAMKESGLVWDEETLEKYLENPKAMVPGTKMIFPGLKSEDEIENVIAFLKTK